MAGFIPETFITDLLNRIDVVDVIGSRIQLKKSGKSYVACCPFHTEKTPSFNVSPDKQVYHCFGCGTSGSALSFVMDYDHLEFVEAIEQFAKQLGLEIPYEEGSSARGQSSIDSPLYALMAEATEFYQQALRTHPKKNQAVNYFKARGLTGVVARDFGLGYAPPGWDNLIKHLQADDEARQKLLIDAGLVVESADTGKRYDRFRERVMFPIRDLKGRVIAFGGRVLGDDKPKYLNSPETPIFHKSEVLYGLHEVRKNNRTLDEVMVLEGYMDVIALAQFGFTNTVATLGTATSGEHVKRLFRLVNNILFCFDGDAAGRKAAWRALESVLPYLQDGRKVKFLFLPEGEDPDSLVRREGADALRARISQQAQSLTEYFFSHLSSEAVPNTLEGKAHLASIVSPLLSTMPNSGLKTLMYQKLEELTGLDQANLVTLHTPVISKQTNVAANDQKVTSRALEKAIKKVTLLPEMIALRYLLQHPTAISSVDVINELAQNVESDYSELLIHTIDVLKKEPELNSFQLMGKLASFDKKGLLKSLLNTEQLVSNEKDLEKEFIDTILMLVKQQNEMQLDKLQLLLKNGNTLTDDEKQQLKSLLSKKVIQ